MRKIAVSNIDICKLLAFQGIFEVLCEIMRSEDGVVIEDCAELMKTLLTDFNKNYIRELPCVIQVSSELISSPYKDHIINFIFAACTTENDTVHIQNQSYFSKIIPQLFINAYPNSEQQHLLSLKLLKLLLRSNSQGISFLLQADQNDLLDNIVTHCVLSKSFEENIEILFTLLVGTRQLSENFISKVTCAPGYVTIPHVLPIFNHVVNQIILEKSEKIKNLCRIFEILLFANESSKQLAVHLPIDMVSGTLLNKIFNVLMECIGENSKNTEAVSSLLVVWLFESPETVMKLVPSVYNSLLQVINYLENKQGVGQCFVSLVIGLICLYAKLKDIDKLLIKKIGYSELCLKLELLYTIPEFNRILTSQSKVLTHEKCSYPLIKIYKNAVQAVKMHFLKEITESAPEDQKDLAKLIEAQEAVISMHYLKKNNQNDHETSQLLKKIADLEGTVQEKLIEIENLKKNTFLLEYEQHKEARSTVQTLILISGKLDLVEFENLSLQRENKNLNAKVERLHEEIKTYSVKKHEVHTELQLVEVKEKLKIQGNEVEYLKKIIEKKENELIEALEVIGKQEVQLQAISVDLIEIPNEELKLQEIPVDLKEIFNEKKSEICKKETANKSCGTEKQLEVKTELEICKCEMVNVWEKDQKDFWTKETQTTEEAKIVFEEPLQTENWFTEVKDNSDAISFFDNISYKPSTTSFF